MDTPVQEKKEISPSSRRLWFSVVLVLTLSLGVVISVPQVFSQTSDTETKKMVQMFEEILMFIKQNYVDEVDSKTLMDGALKGMFESLGDPYSVYLSREDMRSLTDTTTGKFGGVGIYINKAVPDKDGMLPKGSLPWVEIVAPIEGTPGWRAGLNAGDYITKIEEESTESLTMDQVMNLIRGTPGTKVNLTILRGRAKEFTIAVERAIVEVPTVRSTLLQDKVGYIRVSEFTPYTSGRFKDAVKDLSAKGMKSLVIDLRNNHGGLLDSAYEMCDAFFDNGPIVSVKGRREILNQEFTATASIVIPKDMQVVVLVNRASASAAEILAGCLKDRSRAILVGEKTFGKGLVQQVFNLGDIGFKLTMSRYYTPGGVNFDKVGIQPDVAVAEPELTQAEIDALGALNDSGAIRTFVDAHPGLDDTSVAGFVTATSSSTGLSERLVRRLVRNEQTRRMNEPPITDIDYDIVLQEALKVIKTGLPK